MLATSLIGEYLIVNFLWTGFCSQAAVILLVSYWHCCVFFDDIIMSFLSVFSAVQYDTNQHKMFSFAKKLPLLNRIVTAK